MATIVALDGVAPTIGDGVYLAPTAVLIGDVRVGDRANIWFGAVLRGDISHVEIGEEASVQDNVVMHCAEGLPTRIGARVTIGHGALLEGCVVEEGALIGMGAIVLQRARVGARALVAAGAVVSERNEIPAGVLATGVPAAARKQLSGNARHWVEYAAQDYQVRRRMYLEKSEVVSGGLSEH